MRTCDLTGVMSHRKATFVNSGDRVNYFPNHKVSAANHFGARLSRYRPAIQISIAAAKPRCR